MEAGIGDVEGGHAAGKSVAADAKGDCGASVQRGGHGLERNVVRARSPGADPLRIQAHRSGAVDVEIAVDASALDMQRTAVGVLRRKRRDLRRLPEAGEIVYVERTIERL